MLKWADISIVCKSRAVFVFASRIRFVDQGFLFARLGVNNTFDLLRGGRAAQKNIFNCTDNIQTTYQGNDHKGSP